ncbi:hypothetical protein DFJ73DRAFT_804984 [Zopfochytrium polystomum]|nr:hypothetical protein DFJ73DRAFT_804984 [Zopfochytrium polystomum]
MMIAVPSDPDDLSAGDASLATVIPPLPEETGRPDSNATSLPSFRRDFRQALIFVAAASVNGAPAGPPTAPPTGKPDTVAAVRRDFRQAIIYYAAATVDGGIYTHAAPATLSRPATQRFIFEIVKRSRATFYDLQLALFCFVRLRNAHAASTASTATTSPTAKESLVPPTAATNSDLSSPPTSTTRAWTAIAGLPSDSVDAAERVAPLDAADAAAHTEPANHSSALTEDAAAAAEASSPVVAKKEPRNRRFRRDGLQLDNPFGELVSEIPPTNARYATRRRTAEAAAISTGGLSTPPEASSAPAIPVTARKTLPAKTQKGKTASKAEKQQKTEKPAEAEAVKPPTPEKPPKRRRIRGPSVASAAKSEKAADISTTETAATDIKAETLVEPMAQEKETALAEPDNGHIESAETKGASVTHATSKRLRWRWLDANPPLAPQYPDLHRFTHPLDETHTSHSHHLPIEHTLLPAPAWLPRELDDLAAGLATVGKSFTRIARDYVRTRPTADCVEAYYMRKHEIRRAAGWLRVRRKGPVAMAVSRAAVAAAAAAAAGGVEEWKDGGAGGDEEGENDLVLPCNVLGELL